MLDAGLCAFNITVRRTNYGWSRQPNFETVEEVENLHKSLVNDKRLRGFRQRRIRPWRKRYEIV